MRMFEAANDRRHTIFLHECGYKRQYRYVFGEWPSVLAAITQAPPCHTPEKVVYRSAAQARRAAIRYSNFGNKKQWPYLCRCGKFHLTSKKP